MDALGAFSMWRMQEVLFRMSLKSEPTSTVRDLDQGHVIPNMAPPNWRVIWYPKGFETDIRDERSSACEWCAARRFVISPAQPGRIGGISFVSIHGCRELDVRSGGQWR